MYKIISHPNNLKFVEFYNKNNFHVILSNYGASIYQIGTVDKKGMLETVTLSPLMVNYYYNPKYYGLTIARVAGRIKDAKFTINGVDYYQTANERDNLLHSGENTLAYKLFDFDIQNSDESTKVIYQRKVADMEDGFPGNLELRVEYTMYKNEDTLDVRYLAMSDKDTLLNITNHSYFNLSGNLKSTIEKQILTMNKESILNMDDELIASSISKVSKEYDFREGMAISTYFDVLKETLIRGYDNIFTGKDPLVLSLYDKESGRFLEITSNYKDVVIYTNNTEGNTAFGTSLYDKPYLGIAIEPQRYSRILKKNGLIQKSNELYDYHITYKFSLKEE